MARTVLDALDTLTGTPTVDGLGGEDLIYDSRPDLVSDSRVSEVAVALCAEWNSLKNPETATSFLLDAAEHANPFGARALFDVILDSEDALPAVADGFEEVLRSLARGAGPVRDFALEAWTRLLLGGWAQKKNALFAALEDGVDAEDATPTLVRTLGAALTWSQEKSLERALTTLTTHDELDGDASMELGMYAVSRAARSEDLDDVRALLGIAREHFTLAITDESRPDAVAFDAVIGGVLDQTSGHTVDGTRYDAISGAVYQYLDGYAGVNVGGRAQTTVAWMDLLGDLREADTDRWYTPARTISSLARALAAEKTMVLVVNKQSQRGVRELVQPHVESIASRNADIVTHLHRWVKGEGHDLELRSTIEDFLHQLEAEPPKGRSGSPTAARDALIAAAPADIQEILDHFAALHMPLSYLEQELLVHLLAESEKHAEGGTGRFRTELTVVFHHLIRFASRSLNRGQNSERSPKWFGSAKPWPKEHVLADDLNDSLFGSGLESSVERDNAGGRVDIEIRFSRCHINIEVKRTAKNRDDARLVADFGDQATQYASTDIPIAVLAVADYYRRSTRLDLAAAFHVVPHQLEPDSRRHALTTLRLQANVASPSTSSSKVL